jgi:hypothetical protein
MVALEPLPGHDEAMVTSVSPDGIVGGVSYGDAGREIVFWNTLGEASSLRSELEAAGVDLGDFQLDGDVFVVEGGRTVHGFGHDAAGAGRAWIARRP